MKILFFTGPLTGMGGMESALLNLISNIHNKHEIDICVIGNYVSAKARIPSNVKMIYAPKSLEYLNMDYSRRKWDYSIIERLTICLIKIIRRIIGTKPMIYSILKNYKVTDNYDCAISFVNDTYRFGSYMGGPEFATLYCVNAKKKIAWIHNDANRLGLTHENSYEQYSKFDKIVNVSYTCKEIFDSIFPEFIDKSYVVYNLFDKTKIDCLSSSESPYDNCDCFNFVTVARLDNEQKRIDRAIECCKILKERVRFEFKWHIVGDGPDREKLIAMARDSNVLDVLIFEGYQNNPYKFIKNSELLIMTSDYEAYSMVLTEAITLGVPVICTGYPSAKEIIQHGVNGWLTQKLDAHELAELIERVIADNLLVSVKKSISNCASYNEVALKQFEALIRM